MLSIIILFFLLLLEKGLLAIWLLDCWFFFGRIFGLFLYFFVLLKNLERLILHFIVFLSVNLIPLVLVLFVAISLTLTSFRYLLRLRLLCRLVDGIL